LQKLVANDRVRTVIEKTQNALPALLAGSLKGESGSRDYLTKDEFNEFKDGLMTRFKSLVGETS
jgi:hypothetical protein